MNLKYEDIEPYLLDYLQGNVDEGMEYRIKAYIKEHPEVQKELEELQEVSQFMQGLPLETPEQSLKIDFYSMLREEEQGITSGQSLSFWAKLQAFIQNKFYGQSLAILASMLIIFMTGYWTASLLNPGGDAVQETVSQEISPQSNEAAREDALANEAEVADETVSESERSLALERNEDKSEESTTLSMNEPQMMPEAKARRQVAPQIAPDPSALPINDEEEMDLPELTVVAAPIPEDRKAFGENAMITRQELNDSLFNQRTNFERQRLSNPDSSNSSNTNLANNPPVVEPNMPTASPNILNQPKPGNYPYRGNYGYYVNNQADESSERIQLVYNQENINNRNDRIVEALIYTLMNDPNPNVRIAAIDALEKFAEEEPTRFQLVQSLNFQQTATVQIAMIDFIVKHQIKEGIPALEKLLERSNLNPLVREQAQIALENLS